MTPHRGGRRTLRGTGGGGRDTATLLADFGHPVPARTPTAPPVTEKGARVPPLPARGPAHPGWGWAASLPPVARYRMTSDQAPALWPLIRGQGLPPYGALMGVDLLAGGAFYCDPMEWVLDDTIPVTNPNVFVFGKPGLGKSGTVKVFAFRMMDYGYRTLVLGDVKDEYEPLCHHLGVTPIAVGPGLPARINPLDPGPLAHGWDRLPAEEATRRTSIIFARWLVLLRALVGSQKINETNVPFTPTDAAAVSTALRDLTGHTTGATRLAPVTIPHLWDALTNPTPELITDCRYAGRQHFLDDTRLLRDSLRQLVSGHLAGLFDAASTITIDWAAPIQSLSLSRLDPLGDEAVGIALTCLSSWGRAMRETAAPGERRIVIRDETWKSLRLGVEAVKGLDADLRLSRSHADIQVVCYHKPSDPLTAGADGSQAVNIARDLLHLGDIKVLHGQDAAVADDLTRLLGLKPLARSLVTGWAMSGKGRALWMVGDRPHQVQIVRTPLEEALTYTHDKITGNTPRISSGGGGR